MKQIVSTAEPPAFTQHQTPQALVSFTPPDAALDALEFEGRYRYGYRYVHEIGPDGVERLGRTPLTRDDVLHPQMGDVQLHNDWHQIYCIYLYNVFNAQLRSDPSAVVFQDTGVYWKDPALDHHSPDVTVILGVKEQKDWTTFDEAEEGVGPALVVEVTSPTYRSADLVDKVKQYAAAGVPLYLIVDTGKARGTKVLQLIGHQLTPGGYVEMDADERGWLWLEPVALWVGVRQGQVECYNRDGVRLGSYAEVSAALAQEAKARAVAEGRAAGAEERAAANMKARTEAEERAAANMKARTEAEERAAANMKARTEAEERAAANMKARTEAEERAAATEARLREMEEELRRLRGAA